LINSINRNLIFDTRPFKIMNAETANMSPRTAAKAHFQNEDEEGPHD
jgi:hypothetical protein